MTRTQFYKIQISYSERGKGAYTLECESTRDSKHSGTEMKTEEKEDNRETQESQENQEAQEPCENQDNQDNQPNSENQESQENQQMSVSSAERQDKIRLAERAAQVAKEAEAALSGKQAIVDQLEQDVRDAEAVVQEEAASYQRTQMNLQIALTAACQAAHLLKSLKNALRIAENSVINSQQAADGTRQELTEKSALLEAAKCRVEALLRQLCAARQVLSAVRQAANKAQAAAKSASCDVQRTRRHLRQRSAKANKQMKDLLSRVQLDERRINKDIANIFS